jgi:predicted deacetylase
VPGTPGVLKNGSTRGWIGCLRLDAAARLAGTVLIVAVHDVAPSTLSEVRWLLSRLDEEGIRPRVLKVVPGEPGASDGLRGELAALVRDEAAAGSEIVLHGWTHHAAGAYRGSLVDRLRARLFAGDAAEFLALQPDEMRLRLTDGRQWLADLGLEAAGFCAPGWLWAPELPASAREAGFRYLVGLRGLLDLRDGRRIGLAPIGFMGGRASTELAWRLGELTIWRPMAALRRSSHRRFFLHPQGAPRSRACARVLREIGRAARTHRSSTFTELLDA